MTFEEFVRAESPALARYARVLTGDRDDAHDVLADSLLTAQSRWNRISKMDYPTAYVRRIVTTTFLSRRRRWSVRNITLTATGDPPTRTQPDMSERVGDRDQLRELLTRLPHRQRAALVLRYFLGLSDRQIAAELGCAQGTVRSLVSRGLATARITDTHRDDIRAAQARTE